MTVVLTLAYLLAAVLFILGLKQLSSPKTARNGNYTAAVGMVIALAATVPQLHFTSAGAIVVLVGVVIGAAFGAAWRAGVRGELIGPGDVARARPGHGGDHACGAVRLRLRRRTGHHESE